MKALLRLNRDAWLKGLYSGELDLGVRFPTLANYGPPYAPWGHPRRVLDDGILYFVVNGGFRARMPDATWELSEGTLFLLGPRVPHELELLEPDKPMTVYHARLRPVLGGRVSWFEDNALRFVRTQGLRTLFEAVVDEGGGSLSWSRERIQALFFLIFTELYRAEAAETQRGLTLGQQARLRRLVRENVQGNLSPSDLAAELGLSPTYFSRLFKVSYRMIPRTWLMKERLRVASLQLMETRRSIYQVAEELGYENVSLFSRQFSREFGQSPRVFRQRHRRRAEIRNAKE